MQVWDVEIENEQSVPGVVWGDSIGFTHVVHRPLL